VRELLTLLGYELNETFDSIPWTVYFWFFFGFQYFVYGQLVSRLVGSNLPNSNYYLYYGTGLLIIMTFNVASWSGRRFVEGAHEGRLRYILSLPIRRGELFLEQLMLGLIANIVRVGPHTRPRPLAQWDAPNHAVNVPDCAAVHKRGCDGNNDLAFVRSVQVV